MLTKDQKKEQVNLGEKEISSAKSMIFADFTGVPTDQIRNLKLALKAVGAKFKVFKKRLLKIAFKNAGIEVPVEKFEAQLGTVFAPKSVYDTAAAVHKFTKDLLKNTKKEFKVVGAYETAEKKFFDAAQFVSIAKLPSREVLLAQIAMMLTMPVKKVMAALNSRKEQLEKQVI